MIRFGLSVTAAALAFSAALPADAAVVTSGCASSSGCTLTELFDSGSITINDVSFTGWSFGFEEDADIDEDTVFVSGIDEVATGAGTADLGLLFTADPAISFPAAVYQFALDVAVNGASSRTLTNLTLNLLEANPGDNGFVEVAGDLTPGGLVTTETDGPATDSEALANLTALHLEPDFQMENIEQQGTNPSLRQFSFVFELTGERNGGISIPEPAALSLLLLGIGGIAAGRRLRMAGR